MPADNFGRYVWLIDLLRSHPHITFEEISRYWEDSAIGDGEELPWRTFMNHKRKIETIFDVIIKCGKGYRYYIADSDRLQGDYFRTWLIDSYSVLNQVSADKRLLGRISFESIPSGQNLLQEVIQAMRLNRVIEIEHQGFGSDYANTFEIEPYHLKVVNRRWYVIARSPYYSELNKRKNKEDGGHRAEEVIRTYALDRIHRISVTDKTFTLPTDFSIDEYFEGCVGIIADKENFEIERVVVKAYESAQKYLETLPLHPSQRVIDCDDESSTFEFHVRPTYDFLTALLQQADQFEVIEPHELRQWLHSIGKNIAHNNK